MYAYAWITHLFAYVSQHIGKCIFSGFVCEDGKARSQATERSARERHAEEHFTRDSSSHRAHSYVSWTKNICKDTIAHQCSRFHFFLAPRDIFIPPYI